MPPSTAPLGTVLTELKEFFDDPIVLGLTATPPDFSTVKEKDADRYFEFFGEIDYKYQSRTRTRFKPCTVPRLCYLYVQQIMKSNTSQS